MNTELQKLINKVENLYLIPIPPHQKIPILRGWNNLKLLGEDCIDKYPNSNYGVHTNFSELFVIDVDIKGDVDGFAKLDTLLTEEEMELLFSSFAVRTPSGGYHLYFKGLVEGSRNPALEGIDIRSTSGQVVAPGSKLRIDGKQIEYKVEQDVELLSIRDYPKLLEKIIPSEGKAVSLKRPTTKPSLDKAFDSLLAAKDGERNNKFNTLAFLTTKYAKEQNVEVDSNILLRLAEAKGLKGEEVERTFHSAFEAAERQAIHFDWLNPEETKDLIIARFLKHLWQGRYMIVDSKAYRYDDGIWVEDIHDSAFYDSMKPLYKHLRAKRNALCEELKKKESEELKLEIKKFSSLMYYSTSVRGNDLTLKAFKSNFKEIKSTYSNFFDDENSRKYIVLNNGVLHLPTLELRPFSPEYKNRIKLQANYLGKGVKNQWLEDTLDFHFHADPKTKENFKHILCYLLTPATHWGKFFCFVGNGGEGKSYLVESMLSAITRDNTSFSSFRRSLSHSLLQKKSFTNVDYELIELQDAHIAHVEEFPDMKHLDIDILKQLVTSEYIEARGAYDKRRTRYANKFKIVITSNSVPTAFDPTEGFWRRLEIIRFNRNFMRAMESAPLKKYRGYKFTPQERDEIFTELINLAPSTVYNEGFKYRSSEASLEEIEENKEENDPYIRFVEERIKNGKNESVTSAKLKEAYTRFAKEEGLFGSPRGLIVYLKNRNIGSYSNHLPHEKRVFKEIFLEEESFYRPGF